MEKITYNNETFYYNKGKVFDESFLVVPSEKASEVLASYYASIDYSNFDEQEMIDFVAEIKNSEQYHTCLNIAFAGFEKYKGSDYYACKVFPIISSCYRSIGQPQKAIDFWMQNKSIYANALTVPLLTSLGAAYLDVRDYKLAKMCADKAYAMQGGGKGFKTELSLLYARLAKETGEGYDRF